MIHPCIWYAYVIIFNNGRGGGTTEMTILLQETVLPKIVFGSTHWSHFYQSESESAYFTLLLIILLFVSSAIIEGLIVNEFFYLLVERWKQTADVKITNRLLLVSKVAFQSSLNSFKLYIFCNEMYLL